MTDQPQGAKSALTVVIQSWWTPALALIALVVGLLAGYFGRPLIAKDLGTAGDVAAATTPAVTTSPAQLSEPTAAVDPTMAAIQSQDQLMSFLVSKTIHFQGDPNAKVTLIEFSDYQWPYCGRFAADAGRQIEATYVETGKVRFGYFNFAFLGQESQWSAEAAECASDQDKFWEFHDYLFSHQNGENKGAFSKDNLKGFAKDMGLDTEAFNTCLDSGKYTQLVTDQTSVARQLGVQSTPTFALNGQGVVGAQSFDYFQEKIEAILNPVAPTP